MCRGCLSAVSSFYDPFRMVGPVTLVAKRVFQMSCKLKLAPSICYRAEVGTSGSSHNQRMDYLFKRETDLPIPDTRIMLQYIRDETQWFKTYVASRVTEIRDSSKPDQWKPVPSKDNPADDASRGQTVVFPSK